MKRLFFSLSFILWYSLSGYAQKIGDVVGEVENGTYKITSSLEEIKSQWKKQLADAGIYSPLLDFEILSGRDKDLKNETYYYLTSTTEDRISKMAVLLTLNNGKFYLFRDESDSPNGTVICTGCLEGCNPEKETYWFCSGGCDSDCTKSITVITPD